MEERSEEKSQGREDRQELDLRLKTDGKKSPFIDYVRKQTQKTYTGIFKDIEITKGQFITLLLLLLSFASVLMIDIFLSIEIGINTNGSDQVKILAGLNPGIFISIGIVIGFNVGGLILDKVKGKRYPMLFSLLIFSIILTSNHILFFRRTGEVVPSMLFLLNSFISGMIFILFLTYFIDYTTILERGRIFSFLIIIMAILIALMVLFIVIGFIFLPVLVHIIAFYYFFRNREKEQPYEPFQKDEINRKINPNVVKYLLILGAYNFAIGLFIPAQQVQALGISRWSTLQVITVLSIAILISIITAVAVGVVFDFSGRKASLSSIILAMSIVNFIRIFNVQIIYFDLVIMLAAILSSFMCVPLFMSDFTERENLGRVFGLSFTIVLFCILLGFYIESILSEFIINIYNQTGVDYPFAEYTSDIVLIGIVNFASIVSLFFLVNSSEAVSAKEQNWYDYLIHLYLIHESGVLLYDYSFVDDKETIESDLASGGLTGLIAILQEITKEEQKLKSIDHGGKRILFLFYGPLTLALIAKEELLILRNKLKSLIQEIDEKYNVKNMEFDGVDVNLWKQRIDPIMEKNFKRKYFELFSELFLPE